MSNDKEKPKKQLRKSTVWRDKLNVTDIYELNDTNSEFHQRLQAAVDFNEVNFSWLHGELSKRGIKRAYETILAWTRGGHIYLDDAVAVANILDVSPNWLLLGRSNNK